MRLLVVDDEPDVVESIRLGFSLQWRDVDQRRWQRGNLRCEQQLYRRR